MLTESQLKERKNGIGGSDAAAVCGVSKWRTPLDVYMDKTTDEIKEQNDNRFMYWGSRLESLILSEYIKQTDASVTSDMPIKKHPQFSFMLANIDGFRLDDNSVIECKTSSFAKEWGTPGTDEIPDDYLIQCAHYAVVYDAPRVDIAVLIGGNDFRVYSYSRNKSLEDLIIEKEKNFWENHVLKKYPPPPINNNDFAKAFHKTKGNMKEVDAAVETLVKTANEITKQIKSLEKQKDSIIFSLEEVIADHDGIINSSGKIISTWKFQKTKRLDVTELKNESPQIYNQYLKSSESRVFRLKEI